ncbi:MAG TPA: hypothetical protein VG101_19875 [Puia sp.]|jgi:hypothetical protein|nr:hypothetical protein [Puia sp.]
MKTFVTTILLSILTVVAHAQVDFQPGYYIRNDGTKISCLIKDYGWRNNPKNIVCKNSPDAEPTTIDQESIIEFGVGNAKYQRFEVDVDTSAQGIEDLSKSPVPEYRHETAFLKLLVEGKASLYVYRRKEMTRFYFKLNAATPQPLVFKQYLNESGNIVGNQGYIAQLFDSLSCSASSLPDPATLRYEERGFVHYFIAFNSCIKSAYTDYWAKTGKTAVHLNIRPGVDLASATLTDYSFANPQKYNFGSQVSFRIGAEVEIVLPFNRNKWTVLMEPAYRSYSGKSSSGLQLDYKAAQFLLGARYYLVSDGPSKWYLSASVFADFPISPTLTYENAALSFAGRFGGSISAGYRYKDRVGIELKYTAPQSILVNYENLATHLYATSLILSIRVL